MKLSALASQYVAYKQDMGMRFHTEARTLKSDTPRRAGGLMS